GPNGTFVGMKIAVRSAQPDRAAGQEVVQSLLGHDYGMLYIFDQTVDQQTLGYSMSSFGNFSVVPPYSRGDEKYPLGRNLWGAGPSSDEQPDPKYTEFVRAQSVQPELNVDTSWLSVGHVDEFLSFVKADTPRGWRLLVAAPEQARKMLTDLRDGG